MSIAIVVLLIDTSLFHSFSGVTGVQVEELWSLDKEQFSRLSPIHGLIFLFKWVPDENPAGTIVNDSRANKMFFAKQVRLKTQKALTLSGVFIGKKASIPSYKCCLQVISNACATQAILSVLLNAEQKEMRLGSTLGDFKEFVSAFDAPMKGLALSNSEEIRTVHNSFSR